MNRLLKLRERYEACLDDAEAARAAYHQAIWEMHESGTPLREIAGQLGLSHQRVHQIVGADPGRAPKSKKTQGGFGS